MSFTQRKLNRLKSWGKYNLTLKRYKKQPIIKNVDVEELKKQFTATTENETVNKTKAPAKAKAPVDTAPAVEAPVNETVTIDAEAPSDAALASAAE